MTNISSKLSRALFRIAKMSESLVDSSTKPKTKAIAEKIMSSNYTYFINSLHKLLCKCVEKMVED